MGASPSTPVNCESKEIFSKPHGHGYTNTKTDLIVCRCSSIPSYFLFLLCWAFQFSFRVASQSVPTSTSNGTSPPPALFLNTNSTGKIETHTHSPVDLKLAIVIVVSASAVIFALLFVMGCLKFLRFEIRRKSVPDRVVAICDGDGSTADRSGDSSGKDGDVRRYGWEEINRITTDFSVSRVIGSGGFSTVYLALFPDSTLGAVKIQCSSERLNQVYKQELQILLRLRHRNIVRLLGYCDDREEGVLVFEYVPNGTLQEKLHGGGANGGKLSVLSWRSRMAIAFQLAQAMEYLHEMCSLHIVHGDIKPSNILLDDQFNCKLCDFGSAKMGFSSVVLPRSSSAVNRTILGSQGYVDPYYLVTGLASKKTDIYSFGVIVLELITGIEAFSLESGEKLTSIAGPLLKDAAKVGEMVDPRLDGGFDLEEAMVMASISARCLCASPSLRTSASDILTTMREKIPSISFLLSADKSLEEFPDHTEG